MNFGGAHPGRRGSEHEADWRGQWRRSEREACVYRESAVGNEVPTLVYVRAQPQGLACTQRISPPRSELILLLGEGSGGAHTCEAFPSA